MSPYSYDDSKYALIQKSDVEKTNTNKEDILNVVNKDGEVLKFYEGKPQWDVLPWDALTKVVEAFEFGVKKYKKPFTYKEGIPFNKLFSATMSHLIAWFYFKEDYASDSGIHHLAHVCANALMLLSIIDMKEFDTRPIFLSKKKKEDKKEN